MRNEKRELIIKRGESTTIATAYEWNHGPNSTILESMEGWDSTGAVELSTVPALSRAGSYVIGRHVGEREVVATLNIQSASNIRTLLQTVKANMLSGNEMTLERVYRDQAGEEIRREALKGFITNVVWTRHDINASLAITFKCVNPIKEVFLNGSSTPEAQGAL